MEQIKPLREMKPKERIQYIWDYYKVTILVTIVTVLVVGGVLYHYITYRDPALELLMVNVRQSDDTIPADTFSDFLDANGFDSAKELVEINSALSLDVTSDDFTHRPDIFAICPPFYPQKSWRCCPTA
jgi:hypothetical protein